MACLENTPSVVESGKYSDVERALECVCGGGGRLETDKISCSAIGHVAPSLTHPILVVAKLELSFRACSYVFFSMERLGKHFVRFGMLWGRVAVLERLAVLAFFRGTPGRRRNILARESRIIKFSMEFAEFNLKLFPALNSFK